MVVCFDGYRLQLGTGESIEPAKWNPAKGRSKKGYLHESTLNSQLDTLEQSIRSAAAKLLSDGKSITPELLKERFQQLRNPKPVLPAATVLSTYERYLTEHKGTFTESTLKGHRSSMNTFKGFGSAYSLRLSWEGFSEPLFEKYANYLLTVLEHNNATAWKNIKNLKAFLVWAERQGLPVNPDFHRFTKRRLPKGESSKEIALTPEELAAIRSLDLSDNKRLESVRDAFVFQCSTGMRYGDIQLLKPEHRNGNEIRITTQKNRKPVDVPLFPIAREIWDKYNGKIPTISNQKANDYLKEIAQRAELTEREERVSYSGAKVKSKTVGRWELVGTHTAKRTFVTHRYNDGFTIDMLMEMTGNSRATIERYIRLDKRDLRERIIQRMEMMEAA